MEKRENLAVQVTDAYKSYPSTTVLKGLSLSIPKGTIYGLLGPSGCGKTTLLSILVGTLDLDSGSVYMSVSRRVQVGYMPQEVSLIDGLTMKEQLQYYGTLAGLSNNYIKERVKELSKLLHIPMEDRPASTLSGGQQRRLSLAIALVHKPELLILDEPTVGVDPILNQSIWERLLFMSKEEKTTIIITTHYIEEAKQADNVGLMRNGVIVAEGEPLALMNSFGCQTMEDAFLQICQIQESKAVITKKKIKNSKKPISHFQEDSLKWHRFRGHLFKHFCWMGRNILPMLFVLMLPVSNCFLAYYSIGGDPAGTGIAVVNDDATCKMYNSYEQCEVGAYPICNCKQLSCRYLDTLQSKDIVLNFVDNIDKGYELMKDGAVWAVVHFKGNFSSTVIERMTSGRFSEEDIFEAAEILTWNDRSNYFIREILVKKMIDSFISFLRDIFGECGWSPQLANIPIKFEQPVYGSLDLSNFIINAVPPAIIPPMFFMPASYVLSSVLPEKIGGAWKRALVLGTTMSEILLSYIASTTALMVMVTFLVMLIEFVVFSVPVVGSYNLILLLIFINGYAGMLYGLIISFASGSVTEGCMIGVGTYFSIIQVSGIIWPVEGLSPYLMPWHYIIPVSTSCESLRAILFRGWGIEHYKVWIGFVNTAVYIGVFTIALQGILSLHKLGYDANSSILSSIQQSIRAYFTKKKDEEEEDNLHRNSISTNTQSLEISQ